MMFNRYFIDQGIKEASIENFLREEFPVGDYSKIDFQRTPLGLKVIIWTNKPGKIIGRGGQTINEITASLKERFEMENLQLDVKLIDRPDLDSNIVAKQIASALEKGYNFKKIGNLTLARIMRAGALGAEIVIGGCMGGSKSMTGKFIEGYLKHCGQPSKELVSVGHEVAYTKRSTIGVQVKIMTVFKDISGESRTSMKPLEEHIPKEPREETGESREETPAKKPAPKKEAKPRKKAAPKKTAKKPAKKSAGKKAAPKKPAKKKAAKKPASGVKKED